MEILVPVNMTFSSLLLSPPVLFFLISLTPKVAREALWTEWKDKHKCRAYERAPPPPTPSVPPASTTSSSTDAQASGSGQAPPPAKRAKKDDGSKSSNSAAAAAPVTSMLAPPSTGLSDSSSGSASKAVNLEASIGARKPAPSLIDHMEFYLDCEDPEQV